MKRLIAASLIVLNTLAACSEEKSGKRSEKRDRSSASVASSPILAGATQPTQGMAFQTVRPNGPPRSLPPGVIELSLGAIQDAGGPASPAMIAGRILAPKGWATSSTITWTTNPNDCQEVTSVRWSATAPDGITNVEAFPQQTWSNTPIDRMTCPIAQIVNMEGYLRTLVQGRYPGARIISVGPRPDIYKAMSPSVERNLQMMNDPRIGKQSRFETGEIRYVQTVNGQEIEGIILSAGYFSTNRPYQAYYNGPTIYPMMGSTTGSWSARAPKGQLNLQLLDAVRRSVRMDDRWTLAGMQAQYQRGKVRLADIQAQGEALRQRIAATLAAEKRGGNAWAGYSHDFDGATAGGTSDASQRERLEVLKGVETYDDPIYGGQVQLDNTYDIAWRVQGSDSYILSNDVNFDPNRHDIPAQRLQVSR